MEVSLKGSSQDFGNKNNELLRRSSPGKLSIHAAVSPQNPFFGKYLYAK
jgi:hypothetical protein